MPKARSRGNRRQGGSPVQALVEATGNVHTQHLAHPAQLQGSVPCSRVRSCGVLGCLVYRVVHLVVALEVARPPAGGRRVGCVLSFHTTPDHMPCCPATLRAAPGQYVHVHVRHRLPRLRPVLNG